MIVVAVPGSGKTTTLRIVKERLPRVNIVNFGDVMFELAKSRYGVSSRDEMRRRIPPDEYRRLQEEAAEVIGGFQGDLIIDTHASIKMGRGVYYPGLTHSVIIKMRPTAILVLEFHPSVIIRRRMRDVGVRDRDVESEEEIEEHQMVNRVFALAAANAVGVPVHILDMRRVPETRPFEHAEIAANYIVSLFSESSTH